MIVEHVAPQSGSKERVYQMLKELDKSYLPELNTMVDLNEYSDKINANAEVFYLREHDTDQGLCAVYLNRGQTGFVTTIGILKQAQGKSGGTLLLEAAIADAEIKGFNRIELMVHEDNAAAYALYHKVGFIGSTSKNGWISMCRAQQF